MIKSTYTKHLKEANMINARTFTPIVATVVLVTGFSVIQPTPGSSGGVNDDSTRQRCEFYRTKALRGNQMAQAGQITQRQRAALWLRYRDCVGTRDYLVPLEFRRR